eukprot:4631928-Prymnesium_polylepis.1
MTELGTFGSWEVRGAWYRAQPVFEFVSPVGGLRANRAHPHADRATPEAPRLCSAPSGSFLAGPASRLAGVHTASRPASRPRGAHIG